MQHYRIMIRRVLTDLILGIEPRDNIKLGKTLSLDNNVYEIGRDCQYIISVVFESARN
jgi:hypothetical protein